MNKNKAIVVFENKNIRRTWFNDEWWFSVTDIIQILTQTDRARKYWSDLKVKLRGEGFEVSENIGQLKLIADDGKLRLTDCVTTKKAFRLIQSIPSPKAEPFKMWLAQVGYERVQEIENPELAQTRMKELFKSKGYSQDWIEKRARGIAIRDELTDEWSKRGIQTSRDFAILTAEISKATFDMTPSEYKNFKGLQKENLRDHMDDIELILTMLGEATTTKFTRERNSNQFTHLKEDAVDGGNIAGSTRKNIEKKLGKSIIQKNNFLDKPENQKRLEQKPQKRLA